MERVAGGDAGAGHVNKFSIGVDLISVAGLGCLGSDRACVLVHRARRDATARRASVSRLVCSRAGRRSVRACARCRVCRLCRDSTDA